MVGDSRLQYLERQWPEHARVKPQFLIEPQLTLENIQDFVLSRTDLPHLENGTLMICSVGLFDVIDLVDFSKCNAIPNHEPMTMMDLKEKALVADIVKLVILRLRNASKALEVSLDKSSVVCFTAVLPADPIVFFAKQSECHKPKGHANMSTVLKENLERLRTNIDHICKKVNKHLDRLCLVPPLWNIMCSYHLNCTSVGQPFVDGVNISWDSSKLLTAKLHRFLQELFYGVDTSSECMEFNPDQEVVVGDSHILEVQKVCGSSAPKLCPQEQFYFYRLPIPSMYLLGNGVEELSTTEETKVIMKQLHEGVHLGSQKTLKLFRQSYRGINERELCKEVVGTCYRCQRGSDYCRPYKTESCSPWDTVSVDAIGPLLSGQKGKRSIVSIIDCFSRFVILVPVKEYSIETVSGVFNERVVAYFGRPTHVFSNQGTEFMGHLWKSLLNTLGITQVLKSPYPHIRYRKKHLGHTNTVPLVSEQLADENTSAPPVLELSVCVMTTTKILYTLRFHDRMEAVKWFTTVKVRTPLSVAVFAETTDERNPQTIALRDLAFEVFQLELSEKGWYLRQPFTYFLDRCKPISSEVGEARRRLNTLDRKERSSCSSAPLIRKLRVVINIDEKVFCQTFTNKIVMVKWFTSLKLESSQPVIVYADKTDIHNLQAIALRDLAFEVFELQLTEGGGCLKQPFSYFLNRCKPLSSEIGEIESQLNILNEGGRSGTSMYPVQEISVLLKKGRRTLYTLRFHSKMEVVKWFINVEEAKSQLFATVSAETTEEQNPQTIALGALAFKVFQLEWTENGCCLRQLFSYFLNHCEPLASEVGEPKGRSNTLDEGKGSDQTSLSKEDFQANEKGNASTALSLTKGTAANEKRYNQPKSSRMTSRKRKRPLRKAQQVENRGESSSLFPAPGIYGKLGRTTSIREPGSGQEHLEEYSGVTTAGDLTHPYHAKTNLNSFQQQPPLNSFYKMQKSSMKTKNSEFDRSK